MKLLSIVLLTVFSFILSAQNAESDTTTTESKKGFKRFQSEKDIKFEVERKNNRTYIHHYKYRFAISPFITMYNIDGNNTAWQINSSAKNVGIDFKANASIYVSHKLNLSGSYALTDGQNTIKYSHSRLPEQKENFIASIFICDFGYSYLYDFSGNNYLEFGAGSRFLSLRSEDVQIMLSGDGLGYYFNIVFLRRIAEQFNLVIDFSYSKNELAPTTVSTDRLSIELFQIKLGIQFLTVVSEMFY